MKQDMLGDIAMQRSIAGWDISEIDDEQQYLLSKDHDQLCEFSWIYKLTSRANNLAITSNMKTEQQ